MRLQLVQTHRNQEFDGRPLRFVGKSAAGRGGKAGEFFVLPRVAAIMIYENPDQPRPEIARLCTLCHELGHWQSWREGTRSAAYQESITRPLAEFAELSEDQRREILEEEIRAWRHGYQFALDVGFRDGRAFDEQALKSLEFYRDHLRISAEMRPLDSVTTARADESPTDETRPPASTAADSRGQDTGDGS
jgi:hypothetical protein